ncbi:hypothetical protein [Thermincola potens]|uniref:Uncharacterized protein n=1 Tax=Thermincola potens (strain JR) TaxID=635013 RepID=D5XBD0_THEPJ|nr:hypothetical protein [Thermincola potens]ADG83359.1 conserved hypothetical protein [Thermincola potens JR]
MIALLILIFIVIIAYEVPPLIREKQWRALAVFGTLMLAAMLFSFLAVLGLPVPNISTVVETLFEPVSEAITRLLQ